MTNNVLEKIIATKRLEVAQQKEALPLATVKAQATLSTRDFKGALSESRTSFILECKKASPSKGLIRADFDLDLIAQVYGKYATCISVLTDQTYFQGCHDYLRYVSERVSQPVIGKDFYIDEYQVYLARYYGADAILLMLSVLDDNDYRLLAKVAKSLNMSVLTEVSNRAETERAIALNAEIIGINNRNLRDLSTDIGRTEELAPLIPADRLIISESGIYTHQQVKRLCQCAQGFLVGSSLMAEEQLDLACHQLIYGVQKICGVTRQQDVDAIIEAGAAYAGLIFAQASPRCVSLEQAKALVFEQTRIKFVGVFVDQNVEEVVSTASILGLSAVQLHGNEDADYIAKLREKLSSAVEIWKAVAVANSLPRLPENVDRILFDSQHQGQFGGTGHTFDWQLIATHPNRDKFILAGGLRPENIKQAAALNLGILDINSGVESAPGIKDPNLINDLFIQLRDY